MDAITSSSAMWEKSGVIQMLLLIITGQKKKVGDMVDRGAIDPDVIVHVEHDWQLVNCNFHPF